jgi:protocadherin Fat 4
LHSPYLGYVRENIRTIPTTILWVNAHDADAGSHLRYLMKDGDKGSFRINASTGEVTVHRMLDREKQSEYILTVVAMDAGRPIILIIRHTGMHAY